MLEVAVEGEDVACIELIGHLNETGVCEAGGEIPVFLKKSRDQRRGTAQLKMNFQSPIFDG